MPVKKFIISAVVVCCIVALVGWIVSKTCLSEADAHDQAEIVVADSVLTEKQSAELIATDSSTPEWKSEAQIIVDVQPTVADDSPVASVPTNTSDVTNLISMVYVEGGTFTMGATSEQGDEAYYDEKPIHQVTLSGFYIGQYEVTQKLWETVMTYSGECADGSTISANPSIWLGNSPLSSYGKGDYYPAYNVSYNDIVNVFLPRLNQITSKKYRLPTEAEWEYAARGGKSQGCKYSGSHIADDVAWHSDNSQDTTHEVGKKQPNELGIYDMSGNVWEWCSDWYGSYSSSSQTNPVGASSNSFRVRRGGGWYGGARGCRVSFRYGDNPDIRGCDLGFRLACSK